MPRCIRPTRALAAVPAAGLSLVLLAACGGAGPTTAEPAANGIASGDATTASPGTGTTPGQGRGAGGGRPLPGASGTIAEVSGSSMQVQNTSSQTAVSWTKDTTFTDTVVAKRSDLAVGRCISVTPVATSTAPADEGTAVAAASISLVDAVDGSCGIGGFGGGVVRGGQAPIGAAGQRPDGPQGGGFRGGASGKVVSIDGDTITVESTRPPLPVQDSTTPSTPPTITPTTTSRTVTFSSATTWTKTVASDSDAVKIGRCATALGTAGTTGSVTATSIVLRSATNGECTSFVGRGQTNSPAGA